MIYCCQHGCLLSANCRQLCTASTQPQLPSVVGSKTIDSVELRIVLVSNTERQQQVSQHTAACCFATRQLRPTDGSCHSVTGQWIAKYSIQCCDWKHRHLFCPSSTSAASVTRLLLYDCGTCEQLDAALCSNRRNFSAAAKTHMFILSHLSKAHLSKAVPVQYHVVPRSQAPRPCMHWQEVLCCRQEA